MCRNDLDKIVLRSNERYDILLHLKEQNKQQMMNFKCKSKKQQKHVKEQHGKAEKGILGPCVLRSLSAFDVGTSFMADSLHNVYRGVFVSKILSKKKLVGFYS